jgi:polar amino acid transport system substrate-binding protein
MSMMRKMARLASVSLGLFLACGVWGHAAEVVVFDEGNPPFMYKSGNGVAGIYPALVAEAFKRMKADVEMTALPWKRALNGLDSGENAVGGIYKNSERLKKYDYSEKLFDEVIAVYVLKGKKFSFSGVDSLKGKSVGVIRGWSYGDDFDAAVKAKTVKTEDVGGDAQNFGKLVEGRIDVVLAVKESAAATLASADMGNKVELLDSPLSSNPSFLAFAKSANKTDLIDKFNVAIAAMRKDGSFDKIVASSISSK